MTGGDSRRGVLAPEDDPRQVLGVAPEAGEDEIRAAYLRGVKEHPPERSPEAFERIRDAYQLLRDARGGRAHQLFAVDPGAPLVSLLDGAPPRRRFVGPAPWLAVLRER